MKASELEQELTELDDKVDRLRALYEQYFLGLEKLEPQVPRKEVDRRIWTLRREQIRNTAQRFRFNTIIQRYNSLQQYWGRVTREIENGTYRRDVMKAAARFSAEEVMTAVGKKRVERFKKLLDAQAQTAAENTEKRRRKQVYELDESDSRWRDEDYDAPTPPPQADAVVQDPFAHALISPSNPAQRPVTAEPSPSAAPAAAVSESPPSRKRSGAGLRWGTGPAQPADPEEARRRLAAIAAKAGVAQPAPAPAGRAPLMSSPLDVDVDLAELDGPASPPRPKRRPLMSEPLDVPPDSAPPPDRAPAAAATRAAAARAAGTPLEKKAAEKRARKDLDELRLREIYNQYVETKRRTNESTAGITYEKLADSLKVQADKLRARHAVKTVDYEVVIKNGKALLKPILR